MCIRDSLSALGSYMRVCCYLCYCMVVRLWSGIRLSLIHISEPTRLLSISYAVFCLKKKKKKNYFFFFFLMIRRPPRSTLDRSSAASDVYKRQVLLYGSETMVWNKKYRSKVQCVQMDNLRGMLGVKRINKVRNEYISCLLYT